jgi:HEPN domain-containing protein
VPSIRQVLVFGSVASGVVHEWSDLDFVVVQDTDAPFLDRVKALILLTMPKVGTDFIVYTPREWRDVARRPFVRLEMFEKGKALSMDPQRDAERWLTFAAEDLRMARLATKEEIWNQACFHGHQCVEKCLKALLVGTGQLLPRTHVIPDPWEALTPDARQALLDLKTRMYQLDRFYIPTRYPDAMPGSLPEGLPGRDEADEALQTAEDCLTRWMWVAYRLPVLRVRGVPPAV